MAKDLLLDENDDLLIENGDFRAGDSTVQEVGIILRLNQGELRSMPQIGPGLIRLINSKASKIEVQTIVKTHLALDGKDYEQVKDLLRFNGQSL